MVNQEFVKECGQDLGLDLIGLAAVARLEELLDEPNRPSDLAAPTGTLVVVARKSFTGLNLSHHSGTRQYWGGRIIKRLDETCLKLACALESQGAACFPVSSLMVDFAQKDGIELCPAGQGSPLLKMAAVEAGLGTLGLNGMLLTPEFGPRVYLGGVLCEAEIPAGQPLEQELCLGLEECGLCAAACPPAAIPLQAPRGAVLSEYRGLDAHACSRVSQPLGLHRFKSHLKDVFAHRDRPDDMWSVVGSRTSGALWQEMIMVKEGIFTGCSTCLDICPVGDDFDPSRRAALLDQLRRTDSTDSVGVEHQAEQLSIREPLE